MLFKAGLPWTRLFSALTNVSVELRLSLLACWFRRGRFDSPKHWVSRASAFLHAGRPHRLSLSVSYECWYRSEGLDFQLYLHTASYISGEVGEMQTLALHAPLNASQKILQYGRSSSRDDVGSCS